MADWQTHFHHLLPPLLHPNPMKFTPSSTVYESWHALLPNRHGAMACQKTLPRSAITLHEQNGRFANAFSPSPATTPSPKPYQIHAIQYCIWAWHTRWLNRHRTMACQSLSRSAITLHEQNGRFAKRIFTISCNHPFTQTPWNSPYRVLYMSLTYTMTK